MTIYIPTLINWFIIFPGYTIIIYKNILYSNFASGSGFLDKLKLI